MFIVKCSACGTERTLKNEDKLHSRNKISLEGEYDDLGALTGKVFIMCENAECMEEIILK